MVNVLHKTKKNNNKHKPYIIDMRFTDDFFFLSQMCDQLEHAKNVNELVLLNIQKIKEVLSLQLNQSPTVKTFNWK